MFPSQIFWLLSLLIILESHENRGTPPKIGKKLDETETSAAREWLSQSQSKTNEAVATVRDWWSASRSKSDESIKDFSESMKDLSRKFSFSKNKYGRHELMECGLRLFKEKEFRGAILCFSEAINIKPKAYFYKMRGNCHFEIGELEKAISDYEEAITVKPDDGDARILFCLALFHVGNFTKAMSEAFTLDNYELITLGDRLYDNENYKAAVFCYSEAIRKSSEKEPVYYRRRGFSHWKLGHLKKAIEDFERIITIAPEFTNSWIHLCKVLLEAGEYEEARKVLEKLKNKHDPSLTQDVLDEMNDIRTKIEEMEKAKKVEQLKSGEASKKEELAEDNSK